MFTLPFYPQGHDEPPLAINICQKVLAEKGDARGPPYLASSHTEERAGRWSLWRVQALQQPSEVPSSTLCSSGKPRLTHMEIKVAFVSTATPFSGLQSPNRATLETQS